MNDSTRKDVIKHAKELTQAAINCRQKAEKAHAKWQQAMQEAKQGALTSGISEFDAEFQAANHPKVKALTIENRFRMNQAQVYSLEALQFQNTIIEDTLTQIVHGLNQIAAALDSRVIIDTQENGVL